MLKGVKSNKNRTSKRNNILINNVLIPIKTHKRSFFPVLTASLKLQYFRYFNTLLTPAKPIRFPDDLPNRRPENRLFHQFWEFRTSGCSHHSTFP